MKRAAEVRPQATNEKNPDSNRSTRTREAAATHYYTVNKDVVREKKDVFMFLNHELGGRR